MRRRRLVAGAWAVGTLVVVTAGWWAYDRMVTPDRCAALSAQVVDAPVIRWDNGITRTAPRWIIVLTDGVEVIAPDGQAALARAVEADDEGYADLRRALPEAARVVADRQRARVIDPEPAATRRADPEVRADIAHLRRSVGKECHLV